MGASLLCLIHLKVIKWTFNCYLLRNLYKCLQTVLQVYLFNLQHGVCFVKYLWQCSLKIIYLRLFLLFWPVQSLWPNNKTMFLMCSYSLPQAQYEVTVSWNSHRVFIRTHFHLFFLVIPAPLCAFAITYSRIERVKVLIVLDWTKFKY